MKKELTVRSVIIGVLMAVVLGASNAFLGMKAGMTVAATIPAAVISIGIFRTKFFKGDIYEQNIARTTASVGEALAAGAIFTIPAFVIVEINGNKLWENFHFWTVSLILLCGGLLGILFVILLRRTLCDRGDLPFPESLACYEIVTAGQHKESGAGLIFSSLGVGALVQFFKDPKGILIFKDFTHRFLPFSSAELMGKKHGGGMALFSPSSSPALLSIGYIVGFRIAAVNFSGGILAWLVFIPLILFIQSPDFGPHWQATILDHSYGVWKSVVRPIAVGAMLVGSINTLFGMRESLTKSIKGLFHKDARKDHGKRDEHDKDLSPQVIFGFMAILAVPLYFIFYFFTGSLFSAFIATLIMTLAGFLFSAVGGYLVGLVGGSNQPVSGLTLSTLLLSALLMVVLGLKDAAAVTATIGIASVVCAAICVSGDMIQDLKVGKLIEATPWKMEVSEMISVVFVSFSLVFPMLYLHKADILAGGVGIGGIALPAPQATLMAELSKGVVGGQMAWGLIAVGMALACLLILIKAPSPVLIAVGMYLPFETTFAIFFGGLIKLAFEKKNKIKSEMARKKGILIASGLIAGEAIVGILIAVIYVAAKGVSVGEFLFSPGVLKIFESYSGPASILIFILIGYLLLFYPFKGKKSNMVSK